jgi:hypothetical protein
MRSYFLTDASPKQEVDKVGAEAGRPQHLIGTLDTCSTSNTPPSFVPL